MEETKDKSNLKIHAGLFQITKEYPEIYSRLLLIKNKLSRDCPKTWQEACKERLDRLEKLMLELDPERIKEESERKCSDVNHMISGSIKCKELIYSKYCNKALSETQKLNFFFSNISKFD